MPSKFDKKHVQKSSIFSSKATLERSLLEKTLAFSKKFWHLNLMAFFLDKNLKPQGQ